MAMNYSQIDWQQVAEEAAEFMAEELPDDTRETIDWHGPSLTFLAFDKWFYEDREERQECIDQLFLQMGAAAIEVRASAMSADETTFVVLVTGIPQNNLSIVTDIFWKVWREVQVQRLGGKFNGELKQLMNRYEDEQRQIAARWVSQYLSDPDAAHLEAEAEREYREYVERMHSLDEDGDEDNGDWGQD
jgi:hypothetical protein